MGFTTTSEIDAKAQELLRTYRSYGWSEGAAEQSAAEYYGYQVAALHRRQIEAEECDEEPVAEAVMA